MLSIFAAALLFAGCASAPKTAAEGKAPEAKPAQTPEWKTFRGKVTAIEKYGHAVTDIACADMQKAGYEHGDIVTVRFDNGYTFNAPVVANYDVDKGAFLVRTNHAGGFIAACINYGKLNVTANVGVGSALTVSMKQKAGYREQYALRSLCVLSYGKGKNQNGRRYVRFPKRTHVLPRPVESSILGVLRIAR